MGSSDHHLAQFNIAHMIAPLDDPIMAGFAARLDEINAIADCSPGFVWRLQTEDGDATAIRVFDDPLLLVNMSVWESAEDLHYFMFGTDHKNIMPRGREWFVPMDQPKVACWWIEEGSIPTLHEGRNRLEYLQQNGQSDYAFGYQNRVYNSKQ